MWSWGPCRERARAKARAASVESAAAGGGGRGAMPAVSVVLFCGVFSLLIVILGAILTRLSASRGVAKERPVWPASRPKQKCGGGESGRNGRRQRLPRGPQLQRSWGSW